MKLVLEKVSKLYRGKVVGLKGVSLEVGSGLLGLVGPHGAGKTSLVRILATVTRPTAGRVTWDGVDLARSPDALRAVLGYLPQDFGLYPHLNAVEFLEYLAAVKGLAGRVVGQRIDELLEMFGLAESRKELLGTFSPSKKQRLGLAQALLNDPQLLILDEPTAGLEPEERIRFRSLLADLAGRRIVILATDTPADVEALATDVAILNRGSLVAHCTPEELLRTVEGKVWAWVVPSDELAEARKRYLVSGAVPRGDGVHVRAVSPVRYDADAQPLAPTLEDAYLYWTAAHCDGGEA